MESDGLSANLVDIFIDRGGDGDLDKLEIAPKLNL